LSQVLQLAPALRTALYAGINMDRTIAIKKNVHRDSLLPKEPGPYIALTLGHTTALYCGVAISKEKKKWKLDHPLIHIWHRIWATV
jgi:hypothetical protein